MPYRQNNILLKAVGNMKDYTIYFAANIVQYVLNNIIHTATHANNVGIKTLIQPVL